MPVPPTRSRVPPSRSGRTSSTSRCWSRSASPPTSSPGTSRSAWPIRSLAPALAAGCTAVLKPAEQSPLSALRLAEMALGPGCRPACSTSSPASARRPERRWSAIPWCAASLSPARSPTGRAIMAMAAERTKPVVLELGGKNAVLVFADADLDRLVEDLADGAFGNSGQVCSAASKLLVEASIADELVERLHARAARITVGAGREDRDLGPIVSEEQHAKVTGHIAERPRRRPPRPRRRPPRGSAPRLFRRSDHLRPRRPRRPHRPRGSLRPGRHRHSLHDRSGCPRHRQRHRLRPRRRRLHPGYLAAPCASRRQLEAGSVWINGWFIGGQQAPTGGIKDSGIGRERGLPASATTCRSRTSESGFDAGPIVARLPLSDHACMPAADLATARLLLSTGARRICRRSPP